MKPIKERAEELVNSFTPYVKDWDEFNIIRVTESNAKECALVAVEKIMEAVKQTTDEEILTPVIIYWKKVAEEIKKM